MIDKENQTNNINSITTKPSFWGWLWFLVPWLIIVIVSLLFDPITFSPTLLIFAAIIVVPRMISTYRTTYTISSTQVDITQGLLFGAKQYGLPLTKITRVQSKYGMFGKTLNYTTLLLDSTEHGIVPLNYVPNNSDFLKELEKRKKELRLDVKIEKIKKFSLQNLILLGEKNIKTLDNLADLSSDELVEIVGGNLKRSDADKIIMDARKHWFKDEGKNLSNSEKKNLTK